MQKGSNQTDEAKAKISRARKIMKTSDETRAKMSASAKARWAKQKETPQ